MITILRSAFFLAVVTCLALAQPAAAKLSKGDPLPPFELEIATGGHVSSAGLGDSGLAVVSFLALDSKPSRELALSLADLLKKHGKEGFSVVAIAGDPSEKLKEFSAQHGLGYPLCADASHQTMQRYGAEQVVPMTYLVGPGGMIAEVISGGGIATQQVLVAVAEKEFARGNVETAAAVFGDVAKSDPKNLSARAGQAFALAKEGKLERAEDEFKSLGAIGPEGERMASEGLAEVKLRRGDLDGALEQVAKAPASSGYSHVIRGEVATRRGDLEKAKKEFAAGGDKKFAFAWQKSVSFNNLARVSRETGDTNRALQGYDKAIQAEPFMVEARSNKAVALEKAGRTDEAKKTLAAARALAPSDQLVTTLLARIEEQERAKVDLERQKLANQLVNELVESYRSGKLPERSADEWSPRALVVSFLDVGDKLGPLSRDGLADAFVLNLTRRLQESGRIKVVEREMIDKLLAELKLGSSELADPATRLKLGRVLAASVIGTGGFYPTGSKSQLQLRLIDTETTDVRSTLSEDLSSPAEVAVFAEKLGDKIAQTLKAEYPLRGKIASVEDGEIIVGVGRKHGALAGLRFKVVADGDPIKVDGEVIGHKQKTIGALELTKVEDSFAYAKAVEGSEFDKGQHLIEAAP